MKKQTDNPRKNQQRVAIRRQRAFGDALRDWLHACEIKATKRLEKQRKKDARKAKGKRGVDRVPKRLRVKERPATFVHRHQPKWTEHGRFQKGTPTGVERKLKPGNSNAARRRAARVRSELR